MPKLGECEAMEILAELMGEGCVIAVQTISGPEYRITEVGSAVRELELASAEGALLN